MARPAIQKLVPRRRPLATEAAASASFRDPDNAAFRYNGSWYRIARPASAGALRALRTSGLYPNLIASGSLVQFDEVEDSSQVLAAYESSAGRSVGDDVTVFSVENVDIITYPWEWPNSLLAAAAHCTLDLRRALLAINLDLKDASALNVQFRGMRPVFLDIGSIEHWRPNPSWNAARQFIEHFINPLAVGAGERVTAADAWGLSRHRGMRSEVARQLLPKKLRRSVSLALLQATTRPVERNKPSESKFAVDASQNRDLARTATLSLTKRLTKQVTILEGGRHQTTWVEYGTRGHYGSEDLTRKSEFVTAFINAAPGRADLVLDVGGNDGFAATHLARQASARVLVLDADAGALDVLQTRVGGSDDLAKQITPLLGDITNLTPASGLLGEEFAAFVGRIHPTAVTCQAVLHHVVISQGVPMQFAVSALAAFGAPVQIEFATEDDEKSRLLISQIPNWSGEYSTESLLEALRQRFVRVEVVGTTSPTRIIVEAADLKQPMPLRGASLR